MLMKLNKIVVVSLLLCVSRIGAMNLLQPYNPLLKPEYTADYRAQWAFYAETGFNHKAYYGDGSTNALRIWNPTQDALAMLDGFSEGSLIGKKNIEVDANDDGTRGHFCVDGDLDLRFAGAIAMRTFFHRTWAISAYLPFYSTRLHNVCWKDLTLDVTDEDQRTRQLLTNDICANVKELGQGLDIGGWTRNGVGDLTLMVDWFQDFPQAKPLLKTVRVNWWGGLTLPTGLRQDEDKIMALPYGFDGAFGIPFGLGLDLSFVFHVKVGFDVQLTHVFGSTRCRRIKTDPNQTELLLLAKTDAYKDPGLTQQFDLYAQVYKPWNSSFSCMLAYQYMKHDRDTLALCGNIYSANIANTAQSLRDWTLHQIFIRTDYDIGDHLKADTKIFPRIMAYMRLPFNGKRVVANSTVGVVLSLDF